MAYENLVRAVLVDAETWTFNKAGAPYRPPADNGVVLLIDSESHIQMAEYIAYTGLTDNGGSFTLTGVTRAQEGSSAEAWTTGAILLQPSRASLFNAFETLIQSQGSGGGVLNKTDPRTPVFAKTAAQSISIKAGTAVRTATALVTFDVETPVTMPALSAGENYGVWVLPDGTAEALQAPAGAYDWGTHSNPDAVMIGGFHYGLVAPGTTPASGGFSTSGFTGDGGSMVWAQADVDKIAGINEHSLWDLQFHPKKFGIKGFVFDPEVRAWSALYFTGTNHIVDGLSKAGSNIASGTVLPRIPLAYGGNGSNNYSRLSWYEANEIVQSHGCRLLEYQEFSSGAFGVTEAQSLGGASATPALTVRQPGYTSRLGWEQATGHVWSWGFNAHGAGGSAWVTGPNRGHNYGTPYAALFGGYRTDAGNSGSRCASWLNSAWSSSWSYCVRAACDHVEPV